MLSRRGFLGTLAAVAVAPFVPTPTPAPTTFVGVDLAWDGNTEDPADFTAVVKRCGCYTVTRGKVTEHYACAPHLPTCREVARRYAVFDPTDQTRAVFKYR